MMVVYRKDKDGIIYATLEDVGITVCLNNGKWLESFPYWILGNEELYIKIKEEDVLIKPYKILQELYEKYLADKNDKDSFKTFIINFIDYAKEDYYKKMHNKNSDLKYFAKELDIHYENCGYYEMFDDYYDDYLLRKDIFPFNLIEIIKLDNDYLLILNNNILEK